MSLQSEPYYWYECDAPDCKAKSTGGGEYTAWSDQAAAWDEADGSDWLQVDGKHYCDMHARAYDPEQQEEDDVR